LYQAPEHVTEKSGGHQAWQPFTEGLLQDQFKNTSSAGLG